MLPTILQTIPSANDYRPWQLPAIPFLQQELCGPNTWMPYCKRPNIPWIPTTRSNPLFTIYSWTYLLHICNAPRPEHVERILNIVEDRRQHPETAPPLKIVVVGGSVTEGVGCDQDGRIKGRACNWSVRLESFVNNILGFHAVKVFNIANGGTNTEQALSLIKYWMYPDDLGGPPDIIIHAYGANDSNSGKVNEEVDRIQVLFSQVLNRLNWFTATVFQSHACPAPIIFHLDDFVGGHNQGGIIGDVTYRIILREVAGWYQNFAVSSARVVSPFIYPDTQGETTFSPAWRYKPGHKTYEQNCHFGWVGHQAIVWSWAYSFLEVLFNFCDEQDWKEAYKTQEEEIAQDRAS
jgi:lysophospholipase L1-like esterase